MAGQKIFYSLRSESDRGRGARRFTAWVVPIAMAGVTAHAQEQPAGPEVYPNMSCTQLTAEGGKIDAWVKSHESAKGTAMFTSLLAGVLMGLEQRNGGTGQQGQNFLNITQNSQTNSSEDIAHYQKQKQFLQRVASSKNCPSIE